MYACDIVTKSESSQSKQELLAIIKIAQKSYNFHHNFKKLKTSMKGKRLARIEEIKENSKQKLLAIPKRAFLKCFETGAGGDNKNRLKKS